MNNKVAVIMSVYDKDNPEYVKVSIDSILNQTFPCDLIIYQDGMLSNDLNLLLDDLKNKKNDNLVFIKASENRGLAYGLNYVINSLITKDYDFIARMDADDISLPSRIDEQVKYLLKHNNIDVVGTFCKEFGASFSLEVKSLPTNHIDLLDFSITRCPFIHPSVMFRKSIFNLEHIRYPENTVFSEDMGLWFRLLANGFHFANIDKVLLEYRLDESTLNRRNGFKKALSEVKLRTKYMFKLNKFTTKNTCYILSRFIFHVLPPSVMKLAYKYLR